MDMTPEALVDFHHPGACQGQHEPMNHSVGHGGAPLWAMEGGDGGYNSVKAEESFVNGLTMGAADIGGWDDMENCEATDAAQDAELFADSLLSM